MKARLPMSNNMKKVVKGYIEDYFHENQHTAIRRFMKIVLLTMHRNYGFGRQRLELLAARIENTFLELHQYDEDFEVKIDQTLKDETGYEYNGYFLEKQRATHSRIKGQGE